MQTHQIAISKQGALKDFRTLINTDGSISKGSAELYQHCMTKFGRFLDEQGIGWGEVTRRVVVGYLDVLIGEGLKNSSVNSSLKAIKRSYRAMIEAGRAVENPVDGVKYLPESSSTKKRWMPESEARRLLRALDGRQGEAGSRDRAVIMTLLYTGLRASELCALRWDDIIMDGEQPVGLVVRRGKGRRPREVELHAKAWGAITEYARYYRGERLFSTVVTARHGERRPLTRHSLLCLVKRAGARMGTKLFTHMMRHTHASAALQNGCSVVSLSHRLGHASVAMTLDCYTHSDDKVVQYLSF